jgi:hypothetical protein
MDDATKPKTLGTPADFLRHAEALIKFEADQLGAAHKPTVTSLAALANKPAPDAAAHDDKPGAVVRAFPRAKVKKDSSS